MMEKITPNAPTSYGGLDSFARFTRHDAVRRRMLLDTLLAAEPALQAGTEANVREEVIGPLVDLMHTPGERITRDLANGMRFTLAYTSKIARDFVLAPGPRPQVVWEPQTTKAALALSRGRQSVVVGGAYVGDQAILIAHGLAPGGACHCFELDADNIALLAENAQVNGVDNIHVHRLALWSVDDARINLTGEDSHATPSEAASGDAGTFLSRTIDTLAREHGLATIDLILLDIEGGEDAALAGASHFLAQPAATAPAVIFEIHSAYVDWSDGLARTPVVARLLSAGYEVFGLRDYQGNENMDGLPVELVDHASAVISGPRHGFNMLAVKDRSRLDPAVFRFVSGVSPKLLKHRDPALHQPLP
jgi:FkbM family methyltransferase